MHIFMYICMSQENKLHRVKVITKNMRDIDEQTNTF